VRTLIFAAGLLAVAGIPGASAEDADLIDLISEEALRRHVTVLASDAFEGRFPGTRGGDRAADYLSRTLEAMGLEALGDDGTYYQRVPLHGATPLPSSRLELWSLGQSRRLELGEDYLLFTTGDQTTIAGRVPLVFVGYGIVAPEFDYNDYHDVEVRGKVVVYLAGEPPSDDPDYFAGADPTVYAAPETKKRIALSRGARGSLLIPRVRGDTAAAWERTRRQFVLEDLTLPYAVPGHLSAVLHPESPAWLFHDSLYDADQVATMEATNTLRSFHLPMSLRFQGEFHTRDVLSSNVVAIRRGWDPKLADSYVVVSAHYDHLGVDLELEGDQIYNGAVDNALGTAGALELARILAAPEMIPRRSVIFVFTTAEEEGLLGARYFLDHPPVPLSKIVANINVDGLAFHDSFNDLVGIGAELSSLGEMLETAAENIGLEVTRPPAEVWSAEAYGRSDQLAFAEAGIPAILVNEGFSWHNANRDQALRRSLEWFQNTYHTPADDLGQPLNFGAARLHLGAILTLLREATESTKPPRWRPGVPYAYQRLLSLAEGR
jgi:hypothetical protein